jgi:hypothetical protein
VASASTEEATSCAARSGKPDVAVPVVEIYLKSKSSGKIIWILATLDNNSNTTYFLTPYAEKIGAKPNGRTKLNLSTLNREETLDTFTVALEVESTLGKKKSREVIELSKVVLIDSFACMNSLVKKSDIATWPHLRDIWRMLMTLQKSRYS